VFLLWLDLDDFKVVNDSLGHQAGDQLLLEVGERLRACLRPGDTPARMGGDEFTVLLADLDGVQNAIRVAERIGADLRVPFQVDGHEMIVRTSIGIAESAPGLTTPEELLRNADIAMYEAKKQGKGQYQVFLPGMDQAAWKRLEMEAELRIAWNGSSSSCTTSRSWISRAVRSASWKPWSAGITPPAGRVHSTRRADRPHRSTGRVGSRPRMPAVGGLGDTARPAAPGRGVR
jgi:diguanylate cyclase (GGDEF)-like protein